MIGTCASSAAAGIGTTAGTDEGKGSAMDFGPLSELTKNFTPSRRARIEAIKAEMQEEEDRLLAAEAGAPDHGSGPRAGRESGNRAGSAVTRRPAGAAAGRDL